jgi:hypothetical protein
MNRYPTDSGSSFGIGLRAETEFPYRRKSSSADFFSCHVVVPQAFTSVKPGERIFAPAQCLALDAASSWKNHPLVFSWS